MSTTRGQHLIGQVIGSYLLERLLGYGGSSAVYLAQNRLTSEKVAIKVFLPRSTLDKQAQKSFYHRFLREAEATSELDHPNILSIYSYGQHNGLPYIVMPYMSGGTLSEYVTRHGPLPFSLGVYYLEQIASALDYAHENGRVHCDVKPHNILIESEDHIVLSDFGIVQFIEPNRHHVEQAAKSPDTLMGTPDYISPEQAKGEPVDGRSDVYSLAVTLFFLLAGRPPFQADSSLTMALMHAYEPPPPLSEFRDDSTPQVDSVIEKALAKEPENRYQTAGIFSTAFAEAVANIEYYVPTESEARLQAIAASQGSKKAHAPLKSSSYIGSSSKRPANLWKFAVPVILVFAVIIGSILSIFFANKFTTNHGSTHTASTTQIDYLADTDAWLAGTKMYYFKNGQYYINNTSSGVVTSFYIAENNRFSNFRLTVTTTEVSGTFDSADFYGIIFRSATRQNRYYLFEINTCCDGGLYYLYYYDGQSKQKPGWTTVADGAIDDSTSSTFGKTNTITVVAKGSTFQFLVNGKSVGKPITDHSGDAFLSGGEIGLGVEERGTEVAFSHLYINRI